VWAIEHYGVEPDLLVAGKSLGGGLPLASVTGPAEIVDQVGPGGAPEGDAPGVGGRTGTSRPATDEQHGRQADQDDGRDDQYAGAPEKTFHARTDAGQGPDPSDWT